MRKSLFFLIYLIFLSGINATEIGVQGDFSNIYLSSDRKNDTPGKTFEAKDLYWGVDGWIAQELGEGLTFKAGYLTDLPLRRKIFADLTFRFSNITMTIGPFFGIVNTLEKWFNPGMNAGFQMDLPGFLFYRVGFQTTLSPLGKAGDYYLSGEYFTLGIFVPNGIISGGVDYKGFQNYSSSTLSVSDELTSFFLTTEIFMKNFPLRYALDLRYQSLLRSYQSTTTVKTPLNSVLIGNYIGWDITQNLSLFADFSAGLYSFTSDDLVDSKPSNSFLFKTKAGIVLKI